MIQDIRHLGLSKQIGIYHLLFSALAVGITVIGMTLNHFYQEVARQEQRCRPILERTVPQFRMDLLRSEGQGVQALVDKLQRENDLLFACVTSQDGQFVAHSNHRLIGKSTAHSQGTYRISDGVTEIRYQDPQGRSIREWRAPIESGSFVGDVRIATPGKGFLGHLLAFDNALLAILVPLLVVGVGSLMLRRITQPLAAVEQQLVRAAKSPLGKPSVESVEMRSATSLGWNRVVDELSSKEEVIHASLGDREAARWESILDAVPLGIAVTDSEGTVESTNQSFHAYCGASEAEEADNAKTIGQRLEAEAVHGLLTEPAVRSVSDEFTLGGRELRVVRSRQLQNRTTRGRYVWTIRDMTQQRMTDRLHSQFVDAATHELRTPLANIKAYAETLALADGVQVEDQKEFCNIISTEATRLARFIDDLLDVRSLEVGSMMLSKQSVELGKLIREAVDKVKPLMDANELTFSVNQPAKLPEVSLDKDKIFGVLVNLLGNAAKYTPPKGEVEMQISIEDSIFEVAVRDTGVGISKEESERVFDKFFRSEDSRVRDKVGTGLGLSIAKEVVELHDGTLTVESEIDQGTTFTMQIPIS